MTKISLYVKIIFVNGLLATLGVAVAQAMKAAAACVGITRRAIIQTLRATGRRRVRPEVSTVPRMVSAA